MELIFRPKFYRDLRKIKNIKVLRTLSDIFRQIEHAESIEKIGGLKKLHDYSHFYRIKINISPKSDYRLVLMIRGNKVWAERIASVKKIFFKK